MIMRYALLLIVVLLFFSSCKQRGDCPAFDEKFFSYQPYKVGDSIRFENEFGEELLFVINSMEKSESYECISSGPDCVCWMDGYLNAWNNEENSNDIFVFIDVLENEEINGCTFKILGTAISYLPYHGVGVTVKDTVVIFRDSTQMDAYIFEDGHSPQKRIYKAWANEEIGVVKFLDSEKNCTWELVRD